MLWTLGSKCVCFICLNVYSFEKFLCMPYQISNLRIVKASKS